MATRFYLPSSGSAAISPAYSSVWDDTSGVIARKPLVTTKTNTTPATSTLSAAQNASITDVLLCQLVSDPVGPDQTISGTLKGQMRMSESATTANMFPQIVVRVVSSDGSTVRGTLYAGDVRASGFSADELTTTLRNQKNPPPGVSPVTLTSVNALSTDRIIVEVGVRTSNNFAGTLSVRFGDNNASDLAEAGTETTDLNPWVEFSADIDFTSATTVTLTGVATDEQNGALTTVPGTSTLALTGVATDEQTAALTPTPGTSTLALTGVATDEQNGSLAPSAGNVSVPLTGVATDELMGALAAVAGNVSASLGGVATDELAGTLATAPGTAALALAGLGTDELTGSVTPVAGDTSVALSGVDTDEQVGVLTLTGDGIVGLVGVPTDELTGSLVAVAGDVSLTLVGIETDELTGSVTPTQGDNPPITLTGVATDELTGALTSVPGIATISLGGISTDEQTGILIVVPPSITLTLVGVPTDELAGSVIAGLDFPRIVPSPFFVARVKVEDRIVSIPPEDRVVRIAAENRIRDVEIQG